MKSPWKTREDLHQHIYIFGLSLLVCCMPLSRYVLSISQFILLLNWLAEGSFEKKIKIVRRDPSLLIFMSLLLVYIAGLFYSADISGGLVKVRNVLPLAFLSLILATSQSIGIKNYYRLLLLFTLAVTVAALICLAVYFSNPAETTRDFRKISLFIPHIRFALLIIMSIFILAYQGIFKPVELKPVVQVLLWIAALFLIVFLFILRSFAGIIILYICANLFILRAARLRGTQIIYNITVSVVALITIFVVLSITCVVIRDFSATTPDPAKLDKLTPNGNRYENNTSDKILENGNYINLYVCEPELKKEWNARSSIGYDSADLKGQPLKLTLRRYLTSKGLRKDSAGLSMLKNEDIRAIESGQANWHFHARPGLYQRLYETLWEIHIWHRTGFVGYHSFGQRIVFLQSAGEIIRSHLWTGVGTGDVYAGMLQTTLKNGETIEKRWKGEPHNQYAFFLMAFGLPGFIWILFSWIFPVMKTRSYRYLLFNIFSIIMLISMMVLDTIESYDNMVFFVFFYSFYVFIPEFKKKPDGIDHQV